MKNKLKLFVAIAMVGAVTATFATDVEYNVVIQNNSSSYPLYYHGYQFDAYNKAGTVSNASGIIPSNKGEGTLSVAWNFSKNDLPAFLDVTYDYSFIPSFTNCVFTVIPAVNGSAPVVNATAFGTIDCKIKVGSPNNTIYINEKNKG